MENRGTVPGVTGEQRREHAEQVRRAMGEKGIKPSALADLLGVDVRTIRNWTSRAHPTMPNDTDRAKLRRILGDYDTAGDPVERAVRRSQLIEWRQDAVIAFYKRNLYEQGSHEIAPDG